MLKRTHLGLTAASLLAIPLMTAAHAEGYREELREHPRIAAAIHDLQDTITYLETSGHDFGGHKFEAIRASREAIEQLQKAILYRARRDY